MDLPMAELIKLAEMAGVMYEADQANSGDYINYVLIIIIDYLFIARVINSPSTFTYYLDLSNFISESGLSYFLILTICLLLVYFVSAAGCHCFDLYRVQSFLSP